MSTDQRVAELIGKVILESTGRALQVGVDDRIIETGLLDSLSMVNLVMALQQEFDIDVGINDLDEQTFGSPASIAAMVEHRRG